MDKLQFGKLINVLTIWGMRELESHEMNSLVQLIEPEINQVKVDNAIPMQAMLARHGIAISRS